ncbi:class I SAM-dependent methyltransferase [Paraburkholderia sp.]|uniref:class I SAM-dependent methyltransferase n=1 Tax=Paraburkholderia sp. TaxID=1926495 RepID=UPI0025F6991A|nr:class I SAM-dependent methyltransferase [Paraburkholderia sp.]
MNQRLTTPSSELQQSELIRWKTDAWQDPNMVSWYSGRMTQHDSTNALKNTIEISTIRKFACGPEIIDIGIGTGRAALPLLADGYRLTGIDSSQAMLDETRRLAGNAPITLKVGDVSSLPVGDQTFDCAVSLNVLVHFPNWRESLLEWKRAVRPGGRLIFDIHSADNVLASYGSDSARWPDALKQTDGSTNFINYVSRLRLADLVDFADKAGFRIVAAVPYGAFLGGGNVNWLSYPALDGKQSYRRALSWFAYDKGLFDLGVFIEENLVKHLTPRMSGRMFVVLENCPDREANARYAANVAARDAALDQLDFDALLPWLPLSREQYKAEFERLLQPLRSRHFFYLLYKTLKTRLPQFDFRGVLPQDVCEQFEGWMQYAHLDRQATQIARDWATGASFRVKDGVDVTVGTEYNLVKALLEKYFGIFNGGRQ